MPQFEIAFAAPSPRTVRARGRTPEEAVRNAADLDEHAVVRVADEADLQGWQAFETDGDAAGRLRLHQRMQFRRD